MQLPALGWLAWPAASAVIYLALQRARSTNATTAAFFATLLLQLVVQLVT
jgi:hypothetical protein